MARATILSPGAVVKETGRQARPAHSPTTLPPLSMVESTSSLEELPASSNDAPRHGSNGNSALPGWARPLPAPDVRPLDSPGCQHADHGPRDIDCEHRPRPLGRGRAGPRRLRGSLQHRAAGRGAYPDVDRCLRGALCGLRGLCRGPQVHDPPRRDRDRARPSCLGYTSLRCHCGAPHGHPGRRGRMGAPDPHHPGLLVRPDRVAPQLPGSPDSRQPDGDHHHRYRRAAGRAGDRPLRRAGTLARAGCGSRRRCHGRQRCRRGSYGHLGRSPGARGQTSRGGRPRSPRSVSR